MNESLEVRQFKEVKKILDNYNIEFWLDMGTLLGAYRDNKKIKWDTDFDIGVLNHNVPDFNPVCRDLLNLGFAVTQNERKIQIVTNAICLDIYLYHQHKTFARQYWHRSSILWTRLRSKIKALSMFLAVMKFKPDEIKTYQQSTGYISTKITLALLNLIPYKLRKTTIKVINKIVYRYFIVEVPIDYFKNLKNYKLYGVNFKIPIKTEEFLECRYGEDWRIPNKNWDWNLHMLAELRSNFISEDRIVYNEPKLEDKDV